MLFQFNKKLKFETRCVILDDLHQEPSLLTC